MHREFEVHRLTEQGLDAANSIASEFDQLLTTLERDIGVPEGREWSIVKTKLEEACFFAKKAIAQKYSQGATVETTA